MGARSRGAWVAACAVLVAACTVDDDFLDRELFVCDGPSTCGDGWGCLRATPYTDNFCAPDCDASCDGTCTGGEQPLCLRGCIISESGVPGKCQSDDFSCIRTSIERNDGVCYPIQSCDSDEDCGPDELCLTQLLRDLNPPDSPWPFDNLYCVPKQDAEGECPAGSAPQPFLPADAVSVCYPTCSITDPRCPPAMACLTQLHQLAPFIDGIDGPSCVLGNYGLSCQDDTNCFVGSCLDTGSAQGRICTLTCNEASRLARGCESLIDDYSLEGLFAQLECDPTAPSDDGSGLCVVRYKTNYPSCTTEPGSAYECASGLECRQLRPTEVHLCTKSCEADEDCNEGTDRRTWLYECHATLRLCLFQEEV